MVECSSQMQEYFDSLQKRFSEALEICKEAREENLDPSQEVEIAPAPDVAARVEGLVGPVGVAARVRELSKGKKREMVSFEIAREIVEQKFLSDEEKQEHFSLEFQQLLLEQAIRTGLALFTEGVVSAPIEGVSRVEVRKNFDGSSYAAVFFSGPIRGAGGTGQAFTLLLADYCRRLLKIGDFRALEDHVERYVEELALYARKTRAGQYVPSDDEVRHVVRSCAVCIEGEPTEDYEVSKYKNVEGVSTSRVRGGVCLVLSEGLCLKASKVLKISKKAGLDWTWIEKLIKVSKKDAEKVSIRPVSKYIDEIVAGRPIFSYPMRPGGFRLRYGRTRFTGIAAKAIHPAAMVILDEFPAIGTQLKLERPGKGCIATPCNEIDGPIVLLESGDVKQLQTLQEAKHLSGKVKEVLFLGDLLVNYGDFYKSNHPLVQAAWCQEWFKLLLEKEGVRKTINEINEMSFEEALALSQEKKVPLSPKFTFFYHDLSSTQLFELCQWLCTGSLLFEGERFNGLKVKTAEQKRLLECLGVPHVLQEGFVNVDCENALALLSTLGLLDGKILSSARIESFFDGQVDSMTLVNNASGFKVMKKAGLYVGASMGRPEKAKERKMQPPVHALFPIGQHGGKIRSVVKAIKNLREGGGFSSGLAELEVANRVCPKCRQKLLNAKCPSCNLRAVELSSCSKCGTPLRQDQKKCKCGSFGSLAEKRQVNVYEEFNRACKNVAFVPKEIKGVIGLISASKTPELLEKGLLRAKHSVFVFRDGTCRFDATEVPLTHFVPAEVGTSVEKLKELGYVKDVEGKPLKSASQVVELKPQDLVLSNNGADYLLKVARFVDDELSYVYRKKPFYNAKSLDDMVGHQVIVIAPHTSAGILGRIIGFTTARGILAHPYLHCATRRNCLSSSQMVYYENDSAVHVESAAQMFQKYFELFGSVEQHAVQKVELLKKRKVFAFGAVTNGKQSKKRVKSISRRWFEGRVLEIKAENGQEVEVTPNHVVWVWNGTELKEKVAGELCEDDLLASLSNVSTSENVLRELNLVDVFETDDESDSFSVRTSKDFCKKVVSSFGGMQRLQEKLGLSKIQVKNYFFRAPHSLPLSVYLKVRTRSSDAVFSLGFKHNFASLPITLKLSDAFFKLLGYYVSEGWIWKSNVTGKESFHVGFAASVKEIRGELSQLLKEVFKLQATVSDKDVVVTNKLLYKFFKEFLCVGKGAYEKQIPELVFSASESQKYAFLSGCFQGDANISRLEVKYCTVSEKLASQLNFLLSSLDIASTFKKEKKNVKSGIVFEKYAKKGKEVPQCILHYVCVYSYDMEKLCKNLSLSGAKKNAIQNSCKKRGRRLLKKTKDLVVSKVKKITERNYSDFVYDLELEKGSDKVFAAGKGKLLMHNCDGDEDCVLLLMDGLLNFSKKFLPETRGGKMDAPLVLTTLLDPLEVDDEVHAMDACSKYPLEFYEASLNNTSPGDVKLDTISSRLGKPSQYEGIGFTHKASLEGPVQTKYVQLGDMAEKVAEELVLMQKVRAVDAQDAAERVLLSHFLPDIYGNLRKFSKQSFRCVGCNAKYRRVPLAGVCRKCGGKLLLTVNKGGIEKYLKLSQNIVEKYGLPNYLKQRLMLIEREINSIFEDEKVKQFSLADYV